MSTNHNLTIAACLALLMGSPIGWCQENVSNGNSVSGHIPSGLVRTVSHDAIAPTDPIRTESQRFSSVTRRGSSSMRTVTSLGIVAGLMLGFIRWTRRQSSDGVVVPSNLVEVVGRVPLDAKFKAHIVRFGDRLLLLSLDGTGVTKLGEINAADFGSRETAPSLRNERDDSPVLNRRDALR